MQQSTGYDPVEAGSTCFSYERASIVK